jgi:hypothetical protein
MKRRLLHLAIALFCIVPQTWAATATQPALGNGSASNPYQITKAEEMLWFAQHVNASTSNASTCAKLTADIDLSTVCSATAGNWTPIANVAAGYKYNTGYKGTFDGNNKTISGLYINSTSSNQQALFCYVGETATIKNLTVVANIYGYYECAAIIVFNNGKISGCTAKGTIVSKGYSGGVVYLNNKSTIEYCTNEASVSSSYADVIGGIVGDNASTINCCINKGTITSTGTYGTCAGGIAGANYTGGSISNSYNLAAVKGKGYVGGVVGYFWGGSVSNCYNTANVTSTGDAISGSTTKDSTPGAIVGCQGLGPTITNCHYLSTITLKKNNAATTLVGVGLGPSEANTYKHTADVFKSGIVTRLLNGGDGTTEQPLSTWGQKLGTDNYPVFMTANNGNAVCAVSIKDVKTYGNKGEIITLPAATLSCIDEKIYFGDYKDAAGNAFVDHYTITDVDISLSQTLIDMSEHKAADGYYEISTPEQMKWFEYYVNAGTNHASICARLTADIDLSTVCSATQGNWTPIANKAAGYAQYDGTQYSGTFDGNNKTINGLYINSTSSECQALFCYVGTAATIKNLTVAVNVNGNYQCAAIAAYNYGTISGCTAQGTIVTQGYSGGIVGWNYGTIGYSTNEASVLCPDAGGIGGIVGDNMNTINCCVNKGTISNTGVRGSDVGGIAGASEADGSISNSYNLAVVTGMGYVGGVVGNFWGGSVSNCYNIADVTSTRDTKVTGGSASICGAIVGFQNSGTSITNCHYLSTITLKKNNAATTLVGVGSGTSEANTYSRSADVFKSGIVARLLNGGNGTKEQPFSTWGQNFGTDNYPVFMTADNGNVVYAATLYNGGSTGTTAYINPDGQTSGGKLTDNQMAVLTDAGIATATLCANVITAENTASRIAITDGKDFYIPADVTADAASYTRSAFRDGYHETLCLPFAPAVLPADYNFSAYTGKDNSTAYFSTVTALNAGQAYMMKYTATANSATAYVTFENNSGNVTVLASPVSSEFIGSYLTVSTSATTNYILGVYDNAEEFRPASETYHLNPFRAYLNIPASVKQMNISFDGEASGVNAATITYENGAYYDLQGIRITSPQKNHIYIHNGKKVIY